MGLHGGGGGGGGEAGLEGGGGGWRLNGRGWVSHDRGGVGWACMGERLDGPAWMWEGLDEPILHLQCSHLLEKNFSC